MVDGGAVQKAPTVSRAGRALRVVVALVVAVVLLGAVSLGAGAAPGPSVSGETIGGTTVGTGVGGTTPGTVVVTPTGPLRVTATPDRALVDGQRVSVTITGLGRTGQLALCGPDAAPGSCDLSSFTPVTPDRGGTVSTSIAVAAVLSGSAGQVDCRTAGAGCRIVLTADGGSTAPVAEFPLAFVPGSALSPPSVVVTPATDLLGNQTVHLEGIDLEPGHATVLAICAAGARTVAACDTGTVLGGVRTVGTDGRLTADVTVPAVASTSAFVARDCRVVACDLAIYRGRAGYEMVGTRIAFRPDAVPPVALPMTVAPATGLVDHQVVDVHASGFREGFVTVSECGSSCRRLGWTHADRSGAIVARGAVLTRFTPDPVTLEGPVPAPVDCRTEACRLVLVQSSDEVISAVAPVAFDPSAPLAPQPTITMQPSAGLVDGQAVTVSGARFAPLAWQGMDEGWGQFASSAVCVGSGVSDSALPAARADCADQGSIPVAADGTISTSYSIVAVVHVGDRTVDCRTAVPRCRFVVGVAGDPVGQASVDLDLAPDGPLLPPPTMTVTPAGPVHDGDAVHVRVAGLRKNEAIAVGQCETGADPSIGCGSQLWSRAQPDGTAEADLLVETTLALTGTDASRRTVDCLASPGRCELTAQIRTTNGAAAGATLHAPLPLVPHPNAVRYRDRMFSSVDVTRDVVYGRALGEDGTMQDLHLDVYQPAGDTARDRPVVVYAHGGYFAFGDKGEGETVGRELAKRGYVVLSVEYRLFDDGGIDDVGRYAKAIPAAQHDVQAAVRWARAHAAERGWSSESIAAMGYSAGAVTALQVAYNSGDPGDSGNPGYPSDVKAAVSLSGAAITMSTPAPPVLMVHGEADDTVPFASGLHTCEAARAAGNRCLFIRYPGLGHDIYSRYTNWLPSVVDFLATDVAAPTPPAPPPSSTTTTTPSPAPTTTAPAAQVLGISDVNTSPPAAAVTATPAFTG